MLVLPEHVGVLAEDADVLQQEIAEIRSIENLQPLLIARIELAALAVGKRRRFACRHLAGPEAAVLPAVDQAGQHARGPALIVDILGLQQLLQQPHLIVDVEHGEIRFQLRHLGMKAQDAAADGMEGAEPLHAFDGLAQHLRQPRLHLARRLVGEGHRQDLVRAGAALAQDMGDAGGQHARLAGAGAGEHQHRAIERFHRLALLGIEPVEIARSAGCGRAGARGYAAGGRLVIGNAGRIRQLTRFGHRANHSPRWHRGAVKGSFLSRD
jgi:hypothetical protein